MSWTKTTRKQYRREGLRYASDLTDREWQLVARLLPKPKRMGRPREVREPCGTSQTLSQYTRPRLLKHRM